MRFLKIAVPALVLTLALGLPGLARAALEVVATSSSMGALVREVAGDHASLAILAPPDRDLHSLQARPSMLRDLRGADLVVAVGAELEVGWLPVAIQQAANPRILPGRQGYFEAAAQVSLLDPGQPADRGQGDVHPMGNPHVYMDPLRMGRIALALADRLTLLDPEHGADYAGRAEAFHAAARERVAQWREAAADAPGALAYHRDVDYLLDRLDVPVLGYVERVPGVPPSGAHVQDLVSRLEGQPGVVLRATFQPAQAAERIAGRLGWEVVALPLEPPLDADGEGYLDHLGQWVEALASAEGR